MKKNARFVAAAAATMLGTIGVARADLVITTPVVVSKLTGATATTNTSYFYHLGGTDLGMPWWDGAGQLHILFGDSGDGVGPGPVSTSPSYFKQSVLLSTGTDTDPTNGLQLLSAFLDAPGQIGNSIPGDRNIPSAAITYDGYDFVHYEDLAEGNLGWCQHQCLDSGAGFAYRETRTGSGAPEVAFQRYEYQWGRLSNFTQVAMLTWNGQVYLFGTPAGRFGGVKLARVKAGGPIAFLWNLIEYWTGTGWSDSESDAVFIVPPKVGELSVQYQPDLKRFVMTYFLATNDGDPVVVMRDAPSLEGPWTEVKRLVDHTTKPQPYGGFVYPFKKPNGTNFGNPSEMYFNLSQWGNPPSSTYNVSLMKGTLSTRTQLDNLISDGGFEAQNVGVGFYFGLCDGVPCTDPLRSRNGWKVDLNHAAIELTGGQPRTGSIDALLTGGGTGWREIDQMVTLKPRANYRLSFWAKSTTGVSGYAGIRTVPAPYLYDKAYPADVEDTGVTSGACFDGAPAMTCQEMAYPSTAGTIVKEAGPFGGLSSYTRQVVEFNAGSNALAMYYAGFYPGAPSATLRIDDVQLTPAEQLIDGGFEMQGAAGNLTYPYVGEGAGAKGIDYATQAYTGLQNAWINTANPSQWNAITQVVKVTPNTRYRMRAMLRTSATFGAGYMGVRQASGSILSEVSFGARTNYTLSAITFTTGPMDTILNAYVGYWTPASGTPTFLQVDDESLSLCKENGVCADTW